MKSLLVVIGFFLTLQSSFANKDDLHISISSVPTFTGKFTEQFKLTCQGNTCDVDSSGIIRKKGKVQKQKIEKELKALIELEKKGVLVNKNERPAKTLRKVTFSSPDLKFETNLGDLLDKNNKSIKTFRSYNKALDKLISQSLKEIK